jgi:hypothetical protein
MLSRFFINNPINENPNLKQITTQKVSYVQRFVEFGVDISLNLAIFSQQITIHNRENRCSVITVLLNLVSEVCPPRSAIGPVSEAPGPLSPGPKSTGVFPQEKFQEKNFTAAADRRGAIRIIDAGRSKRPVGNKPSETLDKPHFQRHSCPGPDF